MFTFFKNINKNLITKSTQDEFALTMQLVDVKELRVNEKFCRIRSEIGEVSDEYTEYINRHRRINGLSYLYKIKVERRDKL